jgi:transcriptional regulator with XRE-family HTH domain
MPTHTLPVTLRQVRKARRLSQLELSLRLGISQRHISFVESGRARPSRELLMAWLQELEAPLVVRNEVMLQAGYAPAYSATLLDDPALTQVNYALQQLLCAHDPMPALIIDANWNLLRLNRGGQWLAATLVPWVSDLTDIGPINLLDMLIHPEGFTKPIVNLHEVGPPFLAHLRHEASVQPTLMPKVDAFAELLHTRLGTQSLHTSWSRPTAPVLTTRYATQHGELAFFSMFTTFGTPQDITLASLRVEHMFAADKATQALIRAHVQ